MAVHQALGGNCSGEVMRAACAPLRHNGSASGSGGASKFLMLELPRGNHCAAGLLLGVWRIQEAEWLHNVQKMETRKSALIAMKGE